MAKRRGNQEGSIYKRGNKWHAQVSLDGRRISKSFETAKECRSWVREIAKQKEAGLSFQSANLLLEEYLGVWLTSVRPKLRPKTWLQYQGIVNRDIVPVLGRTKLVEIKPAQIQSFYSKKLSEGKGFRTVQLIHAVLHRALHIAENQGLIPFNPARKTEKPRVPKKERPVLREDQVKRLLAMTMGTEIGSLLQLALTTGMREGELLGLKWEDIDWASSTIHVSRQLQRLPEKGLVFSQPKTKNSFRTIQVGNQTLKMLMKHKDRQDYLLGAEGNKENTVFTSSTGTPVDVRNMTREFKQALSDAKLPNIRFHDLRHTAASLMLGSGMPLIQISRQLGHARPSITLDIYGHLIPGLGNEAAQRVEELIVPIAAELQQQSSS